MPSGRQSGLPKFIHDKLTKTGYTRGAEKNTIYQNRVTRNNTVLIPRKSWDACKPEAAEAYEKGFVVLVEPSWYFAGAGSHEHLESQGIHLGVNALLLYEVRSDWEEYGPLDTRLHDGTPLAVADSRTAPLGGNYFARIHATTSDAAEQVIEGFNNSSLRGAGIRVFEYASSETIYRCKVQLEALLWLCRNALQDLSPEFVNSDEAGQAMDLALHAAEDAGLLDIPRLLEARIINSELETCCPLCLEPIYVSAFLQRTEQAEGRETRDLTTTEVSLFHISELRVGTLGHRPYNLGWGHHHCNVVVKDDGIEGALAWMRQVLDNQAFAGGL
ncbi:MAG: BstXI family restriction endonuclease [bacterium]|nr:BstXI family restriction endonuclease [bacterium]